MESNRTSVSMPLDGWCDSTDTLPLATNTEPPPPPARGSGDPLRVTGDASGDLLRVSGDPLEAVLGGPERGAMGEGCRSGGLELGEKRLLSMLVFLTGFCSAGVAAALSARRPRSREGGES